MKKIDIMEESMVIIPLIEEAIEAAKPEKYLKDIKIGSNTLLKGNEEIRFNNIYMIAVGKAALSMARPFLNVRFKDRIIISIENDGMDDVIVSSHPLSNENGYLGARKVLDLISRTGEEDLILFLLSGGASAILADYLIPVSSVNALITDLMKAGADIFELNTVRKHLSFLKGGKLVKQTRSKILSLIVSDVMGDDLSTIGSGPTYFDNSTFQDAIEILKKFNLDGKYPEIVQILKEPERHGLMETLKKEEFPEWRVINEIICNNEKSLNAVEKKAKEYGYGVANLGTVVSGEARIAAKEIYKKFSSIGKKTVMVSGGETVVTVRGNGKGGRNQEFVLSLVREIKEDEVIASFGTDGIDGISDAAGAVADYSTNIKARTLPVEKYLENNDSYSFFKKTNTLIVTGPTGTNVMDIQIFIRK